MSHSSRDKPANRGAVLDVRVGQSLLIGNTRITVERKAGQIARLRVVADEGIVIQRSPIGSSVTAL